MHDIKSDATRQDPEWLRQQLERSEQRHLLWAEQSYDVIWTMNLDGGFTYISPSMERLVGYSPEEFIQLPMEQRFTSESFTVVQHSLAEANANVAAGKAIDFRSREIEHRHKDGSTVWAEVTAIAIYDQDGRFLEIFGITRDISERKGAEAAMLAAKEQVEHLRAVAAEGEQRLRTVLETVGEVIFQMDEGGALTFLNPAWNRVSGMEIEQCLGRPLTDFLSPEDESLVREALRSVLDTGQQSQRFEASLPTVDSLPRWVTMRLWPSHLRPSSGGVTGTMSDITEIKQAERMKRELTATVSHELRTPLTSIAGAIGLLNGGAAGPLPEAARNLVAIADKNAQRLRVLIDDLLDMEKLLAGKLPFAFEDLELRPLLEQALNEHQPFADSHGVRLTLADHIDHARVHTDPGRFQQVLSNLLSNAVKFSPEGGEVLVTATAVAQAIHVEVRDRGPGIDPEFHPQVFQKFAQADASDTRRRGGTGLGLAITRELVEQMHGRIGFDSTPGDGATFWFELPVPSSN
jgi:PAS domain S-box-containing protein